MTIRPARPSDVDPALALWRGLHDEHESLDGAYRLADDAAARWSADFREWTRSRTSRIWLALDAARPVGLLTAHLYETVPTFQTVSLVHVDDLYVVPGARGAGLGAQLLAQARQWGAEHGATELRAGVLAANAAGRAFWESQGARDFSVTVRLDT